MPRRLGEVDHRLGIMALVSYHLCGLLAWVYRVTWGCLYSARKPKRLGGHFTLSFPQPPLKTGRSVQSGAWHRHRCGPRPAPWHSHTPLQSPSGSRCSRVLPARHASSSRLVAAGCSHITRGPAQQSDAGDDAAAGRSFTAVSMFGYQRLTMAPTSPSSVFTRVCSNTRAPGEDHGFGCFFQKRM